MAGKRCAQRVARRRAARAVAAVECLEPRTLFSAEIRSFDGTGNNLLHANWGVAGEALLRLVQAQYADGISAPTGADRPSARIISNELAAHPAGEEILSASHLSAFAYLWGQFIDHDLDLTTTSSANGLMNIAMPLGDAWFDPFETGTQVMGMGRADYAAGTGVTSARQQVNVISPFLDGSMIYGSDAARAAALREFKGGRLLTSAGGLMPYNTTGLANANDAHLYADDKLFLAGDVRANENAELTALHTLFVREHNRQAARIARENPRWTDEQVYQQARRMVIGEIQQITYNEFLPALLGKNALGRYTGYNPNVNAAVSNEFSTAAFRLGHSMLADDVEFINNDGTEAREEMALADVFFNPHVVEENGIDTILKYLSSSNAEEIDTMVVDGVRNFLFGPPGAGGLDLASLNIQRGRDHGLADYNTTRAILGLPKVTSFDQITSDDALADKLEALYGSVDKVDLWVGGLAEDHLRGNNLGATFQKILVDQFTRTRAGDRFWYERDLSFRDLARVRSTTLGDIISANTGISNLQENVFKFEVEVSGQIMLRSLFSRFGPRAVGVPGITVELLDESGAVVASTVTVRNGQYRFADVTLGKFTVRPVLPEKFDFVTEPTRTLTVSRGGEIRNLNFALRLDTVLSGGLSSSRLA